MGTHGTDAHLTPWCCRDRHIRRSRFPVVMGILNVTPDSFSDGGQHHALDAALAHARQMISDGATIIDIGGESTRPGAVPVSAEDEKARVLPVVKALAAESDILLSIDTTKADVARSALAAGAHIINDVSATSADDAMAAVAAESGAGLILMHMAGDPRSMQDNPVYEDVVADVLEYLQNRVRAVEALGVRPEQVAIDPGIGFGKTLEHNLALMSNLEQFVREPYPVLIGVSRKRWIEHITGREVGDRLAGSLAGAMVCAQKGAAILRVHDVAPTRDALRVIDALRRGV